MNKEKLITRLVRNHCSKPAMRNGFTLVELLVVIGIMLVLVAIALPSIRFLTKGNTVREAARVVNTFIASAQADAATNEFGGVWIERGNDPNKATRIYKIRRPQRYSGDFEDTTAWIEHGNVSESSGVPCGTNNTDQILVFFFADENSLFEPDQNDVRGINVNDRIQFDSKGPWYIIREICGDVDGDDTDGIPTIQHPNDNSRNAYLCEVILSTNDLSTDQNVGRDAYNFLVRPEEERPVSYRIERTPMISTRDYVQLPKGTYINLADSGFVINDRGLPNDSDLRGSGAEFRSPAGVNKALPIIITFRKDGSVDRIDYELNTGAGYTNKSQFPPSSMYFHIANEREDLDRSFSPLQDLDSLWVSVSRSGGVVATSDATGLGAAAPNSIVARENSRRIARDGQNLNAN